MQLLRQGSFVNVRDFSAVGGRLDLRPLLAVVVMEGRVDIVFSTHGTDAGRRTNGGAHSMLSACRIVGAAGWNILRTREVSIAKLIDHQALKSVGERIQVVDPL